MGAIHSSGGFNNNPTCQQFTAAYKRLLLRSSITGGTDNCETRDQVSILHVLDNADIRSTIGIATVIRKYNLLDIITPQTTDHDYLKAPNVNILSEYKKSAISYIAGYVAKMVEKQLVCIRCCKAIGSIEYCHESTFLSFKDRGGLFKPSISVIKVCEMTEQSIVRMLSTLSGNLPRIKCSIVDAIAISVLEAINLSLMFRFR